MAGGFVTKMILTLDINEMSLLNSVHSICSDAMFKDSILCRIRLRSGEINVLVDLITC